MPQVNRLLRVGEHTKMQSVEFVRPTNRKHLPRPSKEPIFHRVHRQCFDPVCQRDVCKIGVFLFLLLDSGRFRAWLKVDGGRARHEDWHIRTGGAVDRSGATTRGWALGRALGES